MAFLAFVVLAAGGWFFVSALYEYHGYAWADETCASMPSFCSSPATVLIVAIVIAVSLLVVHTIKSP